MVAVRCVRSDRPSLPAVAVCCSGCRLLPEESPAEKPHVFMRRAERTCTGNVNLMVPFRIHRSYCFSLQQNLLTSRQTYCGLGFIQAD